MDSGSTLLTFIVLLLPDFPLCLFQRWNRRGKHPHRILANALLKMQINVAFLNISFQSFDQKKTGIIQKIRFFLFVSTGSDSIGCHAQNRYASFDISREK